VARFYFEGTGGRGRVGGGPGHGGRFCVDISRSLLRMAIEAVWVWVWVVVECWKAGSLVLGCVEVVVVLSS
jgi:hypothetical protein